MLQTGISSYFTLLYHASCLQLSVLKEKLLFTLFCLTVELFNFVQGLMAYHIPLSSIVDLGQKNCYTSTY